MRGATSSMAGFSQEEGKANSLKFSQMISTMMACPDMDTERQILDALGQSDWLQPEPRPDRSPA